MKNSDYQRVTLHSALQIKFLSSSFFFFFLPQIFKSTLTQSYIIVNIPTICIQIFLYVKEQFYGQKKSNL